MNLAAAVSIQGVLVIDGSRTSAKTVINLSHAPVAAQCFHTVDGFNNQTN